MKRSEGLDKVQSVRISGEDLRDIENLRRVLKSAGWDVSVGDVFRAGLFVLNKLDQETLLGLVNEKWGKNG